MDAQYFEDARDMFVTNGWMTFIREVEAAIEQARIENLKDEKEFWQTKGELAALHKVAGYQQALLAAEAQAEQDEQDASSE